MARSRPNRPRSNQRPPPDAATDPAPPGSQAAQSAAYERLRSDQDQLANMFNSPTAPVTPEVTMTGRTTSPRPNTRVIPNSSPAGSANLVGADTMNQWRDIEFSALRASLGALRQINPHNALYAQMLERIAVLQRHARGDVITRNDVLDAAIYSIATADLLGSAPLQADPGNQVEPEFRRQRREPPRGPEPEIHRIRFEHLYSSPTMFVHTSVIMTAGNARHDPQRGYPVLQPRPAAGGPDLRYSYGVYGGELLTAVLPLMGVTCVQVVDAYRFKLEKGRVFGWNEIVPRIAYFLHKTWLSLFNKAPEFAVFRDDVSEITTDQVYDVYAIIQNPPNAEQEKPMLRRFDLGDAAS